MAQDNVQIEMTRREAELLTSLLSTLAGQVQYRATKLGGTARGNDLDYTHRVWQEITLKVAKPIARQDEILSAQEPQGNIHIDRLLRVVRREE